MSFSAHNWLLNKEIQLYFSDLTWPDFLHWLLDSHEMDPSCRAGQARPGPRPTEPAGFEGKQTRLNWTAAVSPQYHHRGVWQFNSGWVWLWCCPKGVHPFSKLVQCKLWRSKYRKINIFIIEPRNIFICSVRLIWLGINNQKGQWLSEKSRCQRSTHCYSSRCPTNHIIRVCSWIWVSL